MKKQVKGIIGLGAVLVVLGGGLAVLKYTDTDDDTDSSSVSVEMPDQQKGSGIILVQDSDELPGTEPKLNEAGEPVEPIEGKVKKIHIKNETSQFDVLVKEDEKLDDGTQTFKYNIDGYEDLDVDSSLLSTLSYNINGITSAQLIEENCQDLKKFGLDSPSITGEMTYESGRVKKYYMGIKNPADTSKTYFMVEGCKNVYTVENSYIANYSKTPKEFVKTLLVEKADSKDDLSNVDSVVVKRKDLEYDVVLKYNARLADGKSGGSSAVHEMIKPVKSFLSVESSSEITHGIFGLNADEVYAVHCTDSDKKAAGLDDPFCRAEIDCGGGVKYVLLFSDVKVDEGDKDNIDDDKKYCYMMLEGGNTIYTISPDKAKWVTFMPVDIASRIVFGSYVWNIDTITISDNQGDKADFEIKPLDTTKDRYSLHTEDFEVKKNGAAFDGERYRKLISYLIDINGESFAFDEPKPTGKPMLSVKLKDGYLNEEHTYEFYDHSMMNVLIVVDGESRFYGSKKTVNDLIENLKKIDSGEEFITAG